MKTLVATVSLGALLVVAACGSNEPSAGPAKEPAPVTLQLATYDDQGVTGGILVDHFVHAVKDLEPSITVEPVYEAAPDEEATIKLIQAGEADLGLVATRAWDLVGVDTLRAVNTPFLIDSTELLDQVVAGDQGSVMMKGLSEAGVSGLAMLPEGLRHPFGTTSAPLGLDDYQGATIRSPHSATTWGFLSAFGAKPMFEEDGYTIAESQFDQAPAAEGTGNVVLFAKADVLVLNDDAKSNLSTKQLDALTQAAESTRDWAIGTFDDDASAAAKYCSNGGKIFAASPAEIASLKDAAAPVIADLKTDSTTAEVIAAIEDLKSGLAAPATITGCPEPAAPSKESLLNGTYSWEVTKKALQDNGVTDQESLDNEPSINTGTLEDGSITLERTQTEGPNKGDSGTQHSTYEFDGKTVTFHWSQSPTNCTKATVKILDDGSLKFSDIVECPEDEAVILLDQVWMRLWKKIG